MIHLTPKIGIALGVAIAAIFLYERSSKAQVRPAPGPLPAPQPQPQPLPAPQVPPAPANPWSDPGQIEDTRPPGTHNVPPGWNDTIGPGGATPTTSDQLGDSIPGMSGEAEGTGAWRRPLFRGVRGVGAISNPFRSAAPPPPVLANPFRRVA